VAGRTAVGRAARDRGGAAVDQVLGGDGVDDALMVVIITTTNSADLIKEREKAGWTLRGVKGSHHIYTHPTRGGHLSVPHPKKDLGAGLARKLRQQAGLLERRVSTMKFIIAIEPGDDTHAFGVVAPDLPGCFSAGDTLDEAIDRAKEAIDFHCQTLIEDGGDVPSARALAEHQADPDFTGWIWAVVEVPVERYFARRRRSTSPCPPAAGEDRRARLRSRRNPLRLSGRGGAGGDALGLGQPALKPCRPHRDG